MSNGVLRIEPGAAERIARAFDTHADNLTEVANRLRNYGQITGFAGFPSAVELDAGFANKARLAVANLERQVEVARRYATSIRAAGVAYREVDDAGLAVQRNVEIQADGEQRPR